MALQIEGQEWSLSPQHETLDADTAKNIALKVSPPVFITAATPIRLKFSGGDSDGLLSNRDGWDLASIKIWGGNGVSLTPLVNYGHYSFSSSETRGVQASARPPSVNRFAATPSTITTGQTTTLSWSVASCDTNCYVQIRTESGTPVGHSTTGSGSVAVDPTLDQKYELIATNPDGTVPGETKVTVRPGPPPPSNNPCTSNACRWFYFRVQQGSWCAPWQVVSNDPDVALNIVQYQNEGALVTPVSDDDYLNQNAGCP